ncbi:uncharacterized protein LOC105687482 [Athalia rosae]|uniref:uncharacterized protein LOC105687482 n=1 Tax=Athalia rosae TaxID=37344 RepID=UPI0020339C2F|nr:uncharacterized protein LOC105687482 [Athalia rosae]
MMSSNLFRTPYYYIDNRPRQMMSMPLRAGIPEIYIISSGAITESLLTDLCAKAPFLQCVLKPEYTSYLNTACTVILGWMVVGWISQLIWSLIAPLTVSALAVVMVCPTTAKWLLRQVAPNQELTVLKFIESFQSVLP